MRRLTSIIVWGPREENSTFVLSDGTHSFRKSFEKNESQSQSKRGNLHSNYRRVVTLTGSFDSRIVPCLS